MTRRARLIESAIIVLACIATFAVMWVKSEGAL